MPEFRFHFFDGSSLFRDACGTSFPDLRAAREAARIALAFHEAESVAAGMQYPDQAWVEVCNADGRVLFIEWAKFLIEGAPLFRSDRRPSL